MILDQKINLKIKGRENWTEVGVLGQEKRVGPFEPTIPHLTSTFAARKRYSPCPWSSG